MQAHEPSATARRRTLRLDEPSIGLHPSNIVGLIGVMNDLIADGTGHPRRPRHADLKSRLIIEMGPQAGINGGQWPSRRNDKAIEDNSGLPNWALLSGKNPDENPQDVPPSTSLRATSALNGFHSHRKP